MKIRVNEGKHYSSIEIEAENIDEAGILLKLTNNANRDPLEIYTYFGNSNKILTTISIKNLKLGKSNFITNKR